MRDVVRNLMKLVYLLLLLISGVVMSWVDGCITNIDGEKFHHE